MNGEEPDDLLEAFPHLYKENHLLCPVPGCTIYSGWDGTPIYPFDKRECVYSGTPFMMVVHLNDKHSMAREDIADWLETLDIDITLGEK